MNIDELALIVKAGFDDISARMATKDDLTKFATKEDLERFATKDDLKKEIDQIRSEMATKDDLEKFATKDDLGKLRSDMLDFIARQNMDLRGDLVVLMRGEDHKLMTLVEIMLEKNLLTKTEANRVAKLQPFPQAV